MVSDEGGQKPPARIADKPEHLKKLCKLCRTTTRVNHKNTRPMSNRKVFYTQGRGHPTLAVSASDWSFRPTCSPSRSVAKRRVVGPALKVLLLASPHGVPSLSSSASSSRLSISHTLSSRFLDEHHTFPFTSFCRLLCFFVPFPGKPFALVPIDPRSSQLYIIYLAVFLTHWFSSTREFHKCCLAIVATSWLHGHC